MASRMDTAVITCADCGKEFHGPATLNLHRGQVHPGSRRVEKHIEALLVMLSVGELNQVAEFVARLIHEERSK